MDKTLTLVGDTATEPSGFGVLLVDMGGVQITGQPGKGIYIPFGNGLGEAGALANGNIPAHDQNTFLVRP